MAGITTEYAGVKIVFNEQKDIWTADLGDMGTRVNASLEKLKASIDRAFIQKKSATFRKPAIRLVNDWGRHSVQHLTVTSIAEPGRFGGREKFWTVDTTTRRRETHGADVLYADDDHNRTLADQIMEIYEKRSDLDRAIQETEKRLHPFVWEGGEGDKA